MRKRWSRYAFLCRYAHQDIFRLLGRDPMAEPLTAAEMVLFLNSTQEHVTEERKPLDGLDGSPGDD